MTAWKRKALRRDIIQIMLFIKRSVALYSLMIKIRTPSPEDVFYQRINYDSENNYRTDVLTELFVITPICKGQDDYQKELFTKN